MAFRFFFSYDLYLHVHVHSIAVDKVECSLEYDAGSVRRKTLEILRNLIAKHDCDSRYADPVRI